MLPGEIFFNGAELSLGGVSIGESHHVYKITTKYEIGHLDQSSLFGLLFTAHCSRFSYMFCPFFSPRGERVRVRGENDIIFGND
jgi:hypothetical protein